MPTTVQCPHCAENLSVPDGVTQGKARCRRCQGVVELSPARSGLVKQDSVSTARLPRAKPLETPRPNAGSRQPPLPAERASRHTPTESPLAPANFGLPPSPPQNDLLSLLGPPGSQVAGAHQRDGRFGPSESTIVAPPLAPKPTHRPDAPNNDWNASNGARYVAGGGGALFVAYLAFRFCLRLFVAMNRHDHWEASNPPPRRPEVRVEAPTGMPAMPPAAPGSIYDDWISEYDHYDPSRDLPPALLPGYGRSAPPGSPAGYPGPAGDHLGPLRPGVAVPGHGAAAPGIPPGMPPAGPAGGYPRAPFSRGRSRY